MVEDIYFATITERSGEGWRVLTSPVPGTSLATLLDPIWTQGPAGSDDPNTPDGNENILFLNTTTNQYEAPADMDREIADGEGFAVYVFARDDYEDENSVTWPKILSVPGQPRTSDLSLDNARLANAAGQFTLLGNPFAETISIGNFSAFSLNNIAQVFYVYDHDFRPDSFTAPDLPGDEPPAGPGGGFRAWNGTTGGLTDGLIAAFQGFYVETTGASPTLTIPASAVTTGGTLFGTPDSETFAFEIAARINQRQSGMTFFSFGEDGSLSFNQRDARMLYPLDFSPFLAIYSEADGQTTHIKHLPSELAEAVVLPLHIEAWQPNAGFTAYEPIQGSVEMVWPDVSNLPAAWTVTLTDTFTGVVLNLRETDRYDFVTGDVERSAGRTLTHELALRRVPATERAGTRFLLTIDPEMPTSAPVTGELPRALALSQNYPNPFNPTTMIRFEMP
ncbi:MAG: hypothetical protein JJU35_14315, partial [Balneolales bacterium]|nr:hypothetical protein [Balneolales bacterium]